MKLILDLYNQEVQGNNQEGTGSFVKKALADINVYGMTLLPLMERGSQGGTPTRGGS